MEFLELQTSKLMKFQFMKICWKYLLFNHMRQLLNYFLCVVTQRVMQNFLSFIKNYLQFVITVVLTIGYNYCWDITAIPIAIAILSFKLG